MNEVAGHIREVDVVILTWNDGDLLGAAVSSVLDTQGVQVNVFIVDNGSEPSATAPDWPNIRLVRNGDNRGVAAGRNQGVALGMAEFVCLLDSDAQLMPDSLSTLLEPFDDTSVGVAVPVFAGQQPEDSGGKAPTLWVKIQRGLNRRSDYESLPRDPTTPWWDVDFGIGACQVFRRSVFEQVGGLDEAIFYGPEDVDFCLRVGEAGWRVVQVPDCDVVHPPRRAFRKPFSRRSWLHVKGLLRHYCRRRRCR